MATPPATVEPGPTSLPAEPGDTATATPEPTDTPPEVEVTPEAPATPEPVPTPALTPVPDAESESGELPAATEDVEQTPDPEQVPTPEETVAEETVAETSDAEAETPPADPGESPEKAEGSTGDEDAVTEDDLAATVAAMRALDDEEFDAEELASLAPEPAFTVFGCNVPLHGEEAVNAVSAGGDYLIAMAGLFGLIIARVRPRRNQKRGSKTP